MAWWNDACARRAAPRERATSLRRHAPRLLAAALVVAAGTFASTPSRADDAADQSAARDAYDRGARAFGQGSYAVAATEFARADELRPAPAALEAALKAAILAEDPVLAMTLVDRAAARPSNDGVAAQVARARDRFAHKVGRLTVQCAEACSAKVSDEPVPVGVARYYLAGNYVIEIEASGSHELFAVQVPGGSTMDWKPPAKAPPPAVSSAAAGAAASASATAAPSATQAPPSRVPTALFIGGVVLTAAAGGFAIGFGVDTLSQHDAFVKSPTNEGSLAGQEAQLRTNVLLGTTALTAIATAVIGYFALRSPLQAERSARPGAVFQAPTLALFPSGTTSVARAPLR
ncbi:MAG: hypothetical protein R3B70_30615 [Polyangiaceae bacterium]